MYVCMFVCLCLFPCLLACLLACLFVYLLAWLFVWLFFLLICLYVIHMKPTRPCKQSSTGDFVALLTWRLGQPSDRHSIDLALPGGNQVYSLLVFGV